jgi:SAM-dependent methyltransferase
MVIQAEIESRIRPESSIVQSYLNDMEKEYLMLKDRLPHTATQILDIGCGLAGIDIYLHRHFPESKIFLLDKTGQSKNLHYGLESEASFYNSLRLAHELIERKGVPAECVVEIDIDKDKFPQEKFDLIISLLSWGFHYPVSTYLDEVKRSLAPGGMLIIDVRKSSDGEEILRKNFSKVDTLAFGDKKTSRLVCSQ